MAIVRNPAGVLVNIPDKDLARAQERGYVPATPADIQAEKDKAEAGEHPWQAAAEGFVHGALDVATAIPRAVGGLGEAVAGPNAVSETLGQITPENVQRGLAYATQTGPTPSAPYMQGTPFPGAVEQGLSEQRQRAEANPKAHFAGELAGSVAGFELGGLGAAGSGAAGAAGRIGGKAAAIGAEALVVGGTTGVAQAAEEAHHQGSYLRGQQALVAGGLGTLLAGGLILGGKAAGKFLESRRSPTVPDLTVPRALSNAEHVERIAAMEHPQLKLEGDATTSLGEAATAPGVEDARPAPWHERVPEPGGGGVRGQPADLADVTKREMISGPQGDITVRRPHQTEAELLAEYKAGRPVESEQGMGMRTPEGDVTVRRPHQTEAELLAEYRANRGTIPEEGMGHRPAPKDALSEPVVEPDPSLAGGDDTAAFPRRTRYARGARDVFEPEYGSHDLPLGGRKGAPVEPEELRAALNGEALNSQRRAEKVAKLLEVVPEGAHPDYIRNMTEAQRNAVSDYIGVPKSSEETWKALEDAVAAREGYSPDKGQWFKPSETLENYAGQAPVGTPPPIDALAGTSPPPQAYRPPKPGEIGGLPNVPEAYPPNAPKPGSYTGPRPGAVPGEDVLGINASDARGGAPSAPKGDPKAQSQWQALLGAALKGHMRRRVGGAALGYAVGGPVGGAFGYVAEPAVRFVGGKLFSLAKKSTTMTLDALDMAMLAGEKVPGEWSKTMQAQVSKYGTHHFMGGDQNPEAAFAARQRNLQALAANNGALIRERVGNAFGGLAQDERGALQATVDAAHTGVDYLIQTAPKVIPNVNSLTPMADAQKPTRSEINTYGRVYDAVLHPSTVLRDIADGTVITEQIQAIRAVYPRWYAENLLQPTSERLRALDASGRSILPQQRKIFDTILGVHSGVDNDAFVKQYGDTFAAALAAQQEPPMPSGGKGGANSKGRQMRRASTISARLETGTTKFLQGPK